MYIGVHKVYHLKLLLECNLMNESCAIAKMPSTVELCQFQICAHLFCICMCGLLLCSVTESGIFALEFRPKAIPLHKWTIFLGQSHERGQMLHVTPKKKKNHFVFIWTFIVNKCRLCSDALHCLRKWNGCRTSEFRWAWDKDKINRALHFTCEWWTKAKLKQCPH